MFVPELAEHRRDEGRSGWISTWFPHAGLGRPTWHHFGIGRAFLVDHVLSFFVDDPYVAYSALAIAALAAAAAFTLLFLRALGLDPIAALAGALALSVGTFHAGWPTFLMLNWGFAGTFAALWLFELLLVRSTPLRWVGLVLALHLLLLGAYPQQVAFHAWIAAAYVLFRTTSAPGARGRRVGLLLRLAGAAAAALVSVAPVYADVLIDLSRSIRDALGPDYVVAGLPRLETGLDLRVFLLQVVDTFWLGDPLDDAYPRALSVMPAHTLTPAYAGLVALALVAGRHARFWWGVVAAAILLTISAPLYRFAAAHLGMSFSRLSPFVAALPGFAVLAAAGLHAALARRGLGAKGAVLALLPSAAALVAAAPGDVPLDGAAVVLGVGAAAVTALAAFTGSRVVAVALLVLLPFTYGQRMVLLHPRDEIRTTSPLVERVRGELRPAGTRFAWVGPRPPALLSSNQEAVLGLRSIHTHDAFASRAFADWAEALHPVRPMLEATDGEPGAATYDRRFPRVGHESRLTDDVLATAAISVLLSTRPLAERVATPIGTVAGVHLSRPRVVGPVAAAVPGFERTAPAEVRVAPVDLLDDAARAAVKHDATTANHESFALRDDDRPRLLFSSRIHHPSWRATAGDRPLETVRVNDLFLGVVVPAGVVRVDLDFRPWVRFAWIPQAALVLSLLGAGVLARRGRRAETPPSTGRSP